MLYESCQNESGSFPSINSAKSKALIKKVKKKHPENKLWMVQGIISI